MNKKLKIKIAIIICILMYLFIQIASINIINKKAETILKSIDFTKVSTMLISDNRSSEIEINDFNILEQIDFIVKETLSYKEKGVKQREPLEVYTLKFSYNNNNYKVYILCSSKHDYIYLRLIYGNHCGHICYSVEHSFCTYVNLFFKSFFKQ